MTAWVRRAKPLAICKRWIFTTIIERRKCASSTEKWFAVVVLAINYLQFQAAQAYLSAHTCLPLANFIRQHRLEHLQVLLRTVIQEARQSQDVNAILARYLPVTSSLVT